MEITLNNIDDIINNKYSKFEVLIQYEDEIKDRYSSFNKKWIKNIIKDNLNHKYYYVVWLDDDARETFGVEKISKLYAFVDVYLNKINPVFKNAITLVYFFTYLIGSVN